MESSSEISDSSFSDNSFLWADTASDSTDDSMADRKQANSYITNMDVEIPAKKKSKHMSESSVTSSDRFLDEKVKQEKIYKTEEANFSKPKNKKKESKLIQNSENANDHSCVVSKGSHLKLEESEDTFNKLKKNSKCYDSQSSLADDDSYLHMKVKKEHILAKSLGEQKQKSKKRKQSEHESKYNESSESEVINSSQPKKKRNKSIKSHDDDLENLHSYNIVIDKFTAEETVVGVQQPQSGQAHQSELKENDTFMEQSDEASSDEISAIKGYDDHNLHSTLFSNKSIENDVSKKLNSSSDSEKSTDENISKKSVEINRKQKLSDRILFEDDDDDNNKSSKLNNYLRKNPILKNISHNLKSSAIITNDDHLWILKCPKEIDVDDFQGIDFKMDGTSKIKINGQSYESSVIEEKHGRITVLSMNHTKYDLKHLPMHGMITLRKRIPKLQMNEDSIMVNNQTNFIPLPQTKCRHPLLGVHYKKALKIAERLNAQELKETTSVIITKKKNKHRKHTNEVEVEYERVPEVVLKQEPEPSSEQDRKKKKKRKQVDNEDPPAPRKRRKHNPESAEAWESEKAIEENLFTF